MRADIPFLVNGVLADRRAERSGTPGEATWHKFPIKKTKDF